MTAQGGALRSAWLRAPPHDSRATFLTCYGMAFADLPKLDFSRSSGMAVGVGPRNRQRAAPFRAVYSAP